MRLPATIGAKRPAKFAVQFVNAIRMPANLGVISVTKIKLKECKCVRTESKWIFDKCTNLGNLPKWLILKPEYMEPLRPTPNVNKNTVNTRLQPVYEAIIKHMAGLY